MQAGAVDYPSTPPIPSTVIANKALCHIEFRL